MTFFTTKTLIKRREFGVEPEKIWHSHIYMRALSFPDKHMRQNPF